MRVFFRKTAPGREVSFIIALERGVESRSVRPLLVFLMFE